MLIVIVRAECFIVDAVACSWSWIPVVTAVVSALLSSSNLSIRGSFWMLSPLCSLLLLFLLLLWLSRRNCSLFARCVKLADARILLSTGRFPCLICYTVRHFTSRCWLCTYLHSNSGYILTQAPWLNGRSVAFGCLANAESFDALDKLEACGVEGGRPSVYIQASRVMMSRLVPMIWPFCCRRHDNLSKLLTAHPSRNSRTRQ